MCDWYRLRSLSGEFAFRVSSTGSRRFTRQHSNYPKSSTTRFNSTARNGQDRHDQDRDGLRTWQGAG
jgi:hypothetical protein